MVIVALVGVGACAESKPQSSDQGKGEGKADSRSPESPAAVLGTSCDGRVESLADGITHERWRVDAKAAIAVEPCVDVVRADLRHVRLKVVMASRDGEARPAPRWVEDLGLAAAINAGMFHEGGTAVGLLVDGEHANNGRDNGKLGGYLAFDPRDPAAAPVVIAGRDCPGFDLAALRATYRTVVQSYRLLGCDGAALPWADPKAYSAAAIGLDRDGRVVLLHARAPFLMRDLARALARPELRLTGALFVEGGPEATVAVAGAAGDLLLIGSYETGFVEDDGNDRPWALPNLIALVPRGPGAPR